MVTTKDDQSIRRVILFELNSIPEDRKLKINISIIFFYFKIKLTSILN